MGVSCSIVRLLQVDQHSEDSGSFRKIDVLRKQTVQVMLVERRDGDELLMIVCYHPTIVSLSDVHFKCLDGRVPDEVRVLGTL